MNNNNFLIEESDLELARDICKEIKEPDTRNRAVANALAADIAKKYFTETEVDTESGLHHIAYVLNDIDISDIYIKGSYIDVRLYFNDDELCVPKSHFDRGLLPVAYMFIKLEAELSGGLVTGFVLPSAVDTTKYCNGYYKVNEEDLVSFYDIEGHLVTRYEDNLPDNFEAQVFEYLDGNMQNPNAFYKSLLKSKEARIRLKEAASVKNIFNFVSETVPKKENSPAQDETESFDLLEEAESTGELSIDETIEPLDEAELTEISLEEPVEALEETDTDFDVSMDIDEVDSLEETDTDFDVSMDIDEVDSLEEFETDTLEEEQEISLQSETEPEISDFQESQEISTEPEITFQADNISFADIEEPALQEETNTEDLSNNEFEPLPVIEDTEEPSSAENDIPIQEYETLPEVQNEQEEILEIAEAVDESVQEIQEETVSAQETVEKAQEFSTNVTPSIDSIESANTEDNLEKLLDSDKSVFDEEKTQTEDENTPQIEELFGEETESQEVLEENFTAPVKKGSSKFLPLLGTLTIVAALGYFGYTKFVNPEPPAANEISDSAQETVQQQEEETAAPIQDAMPVETVENVAPAQNSNEGNAISIPAIEQNLDASILVSNLAVTWEVPAGYVSNNTAQRYFKKMGKIIQLNLKSELLLLDKPPITNKIMLELEFNKTKNKFDVKGITASSGEKAVDDIIVQTVRKALDINLKTNMSTFSSISGNPVLIIRL